MSSFPTSPRLPQPLPLPDKSLRNPPRQQRPRPLPHPPLRGRTAPPTRENARELVSPDSSLCYVTRLTAMSSALETGGAASPSELTRTRSRATATTTTTTALGPKDPSLGPTSAPESVSLRWCPLCAELSSTPILVKKELSAANPKISRGTTTILTRRTTDRPHPRHRDSHLPSVHPEAIRAPIWAKFSARFSTLRLATQTLAQRQLLSFRSWLRRWAHFWTVAAAEEAVTGLTTDLRGIPPKEAAVPRNLMLLPLPLPFCHWQSALFSEAAITEEDLRGNPLHSDSHCQQLLPPQRQRRQQRKSLMRGPTVPGLALSPTFHLLASVSRKKDSFEILHRCSFVIGRKWKSTFISRNEFPMKKTEYKRIFSVHFFGSTPTPPFHASINARREAFVFFPNSFLKGGVELVMDY